MSDSQCEPLDLARIRQAFPILKDVVYLNVGTYGLMPEPALRTFLDELAEVERAGQACRIGIDGLVQETRRRIAALLGAAPEEIAFTRNATDGINLVLAGLEWQPGDEVIIANEEHEAMYHPLLYLQQQKSLRVRTVEVSPAAGVMLERLERLASPRTRLLGLSHVTCETGTRLPVREICAWAGQRGILSLIDGAQALGVIPINVREIGCDFYASNGHKWLGGPKGTGVFYGRRERIAELAPAHVGAGSLERADLASGRADLYSTAQRFEYGTRARALYAGLGASLDWLAGLGWERIEKHIATLSGYLKEQVAARPHLHLLTPRDWEASSGLTSFQIDGLVCNDVGLALCQHWHIYTRPVFHYNAIRIATAYFNSRADIDMLMDKLDALVGAQHA